MQQPNAISVGLDTDQARAWPTTRRVDPNTIPPLLKGFSLAEICMLLRAILPQPLFDANAALALLAYQRRRKAAAYRSHRKRTLNRLAERSSENVSL